MYLCPSTNVQVVSGALYHDTSAFLRELVSNSADALEKYRMLRLTEGLKDDNPLNVTIRPYKDEQKLVIADAGVGMTKEELQSNLGTIAKSGTTEFLDKVTSSSGEQASALIGRFGKLFLGKYLA
jgi:heat shock protein beta